MCLWRALASLSFAFAAMPIRRPWRFLAASVRTLICFFAIDRMTTSRSASAISSFRAHSCARLIHCLRASINLRTHGLYHLKRWRYRAGTVLLAFSPFAPMRRLNVDALAQSIDPVGSVLVIGEHERMDDSI